MPSLILRPNGLINAGNWGVNPDTILENISDNDLGTSLINQAQNQAIIVNLDNVPSAQSTSTFTSLTASAITSPTAKGSPAFNLSISDLDGIIFAQTFTNTSGLIQTQTTDVVTINKNDQYINGLTLAFIGLSGTQAKVHELFLTVVYEDDSSGKIIISEIGGLVNITGGKIIL